MTPEAIDIAREFVRSESNRYWTEHIVCLGPTTFESRLAKPIAAAIAAARARGAEEERARIVAWLRQQAENSREDIKHYDDMPEDRIALENGADTDDARAGEIESGAHAQDGGGTR